MTYMEIAPLGRSPAILVALASNHQHGLAMSIQMKARCWPIERPSGPDTNGICKRNYPKQTRATTNSFMSLPASAEPQRLDRFWGMHMLVMTPAVWAGLETGARGILRSDEIGEMPTSYIVLVSQRGAGGDILIYDAAAPRIHDCWKP